MISTTLRGAVPKISRIDSTDSYNYDYSSRSYLFQVHLTYPLVNVYTASGKISLLIAKSS